MVVLILIMGVINMFLELDDLNEFIDDDIYLDENLFNEYKELEYLDLYGDDIDV